MSTNQVNPRPGVSNDIQERTLKVTNIPEKVTKDLLFELFTQCGPVKNVVHKPDFAFIEFENQVSVGYSLALMDGVQLYGKRLELQPKIPNQDTFAYLQRLKEYEFTFASQPQNWWARFGRNDGSPIPPHLCSAVLNKLDHDIPIVPLPSIYGSSSSLNSNNQSPEPNSNYFQRRGNQSHSFNNNSPSSSFHNSHQQQQHHQQSRSHHHHHHHHQQQQHQHHQHHHHNISPPPPLPSRPPSVIALDSPPPPPRDSSRYYSDDRFDARRREDNSYRGSENYGQRNRSEYEYNREDDSYYRRRQRDFNNRDNGGYPGPDRRSDHSPYERYNPYSRPDHRSHYQSQPDFYHQPPNLNYHQQQQLLQDERRNSFPSYRDQRLTSYRPHTRY